MKKVWIKVFALVVAVIACMSFTGCNDEETKTSDESAQKVSNIKLEGAVSNDVKDKIDFDAYITQEAYELKEKENSQKIKLLYPVNAFETDSMKVTYHVDVRKDDNGTTVLEVFGTDFLLEKTAKEIKVEWKSIGLDVKPTEKLHKITGLCITIDGEVHFYQDTFYSPFIEGREMLYEAK